MGALANYPLALAPGMGLNAYFTYTVVKGMGVPWQTALGAVFISGIIFLLLTFGGIRQKLLGAIPHQLHSAVAGSIGLFIAFIGLRNSGIIVPSPATTVTLGDLHAHTTQLAIFGIVLIAVLQAYRVKASMLIGVLATLVVGIALHQVRVSTFDIQPDGDSRHRVPSGHSRCAAPERAGDHLRLLICRSVRQHWDAGSSDRTGRTHRRGPHDSASGQNLLRRCGSARQ